MLGVRGEGEGGRFSGRLLVVFERPEDAEDPTAVAAMRMEGFGPVGGPRWTLVAEPGRARVVVPAERAVAEGNDLGAFTEALLGVPVALRQVAAIVVGIGAPFEPSDRVRIELASAVLPGGERVFWDAARREVRRVVAADYEAIYPDEGRAGDRPLPRVFEIVSGRVEATLRVEELRVNAPLHADSFRLRVPEGFRRAGVRELGRAMRFPER